MSNLVDDVKGLGNEAFRDIGNTFQRFLYQDTSRVLPGQHHVPGQDTDLPVPEAPGQPDPSPGKGDDIDFDR